MNKLLLVLFYFAITTSSSFSQQKEFILKGMIGGIQEETLFLYQDTGENLVLLDSVITKNGEFKFSGKTDHSFVAQLRFSRAKRVRIFISPSEMNLFVHIDEFKFGFLTRKLSGSEAQDRYEDYQNQLQENHKKKLKIADDLELPEVNSDSIKKKALLAEYKKLNQFKRNYFHKYASSPVVSYLIYQEYFESKCNLDDVKEYLKTLNMANPNSIYVRNLNKRVKIIEGLYEKGEFPNITCNTITGEKFNLEKGKYVLFYIWRAWTPDQNEKHYQALNELQTTCNEKGVKLVSLIRNSSYNMIRIPGTNKGELWKPKAAASHNYIEIESLDKSVELVRYLDRKFHAFLLDEEGKIIYQQNTFNTKVLLSELAKYVSKP